MIQQQYNNCGWQNVKLQPMLNNILIHPKWHCDQRQRRKKNGMHTSMYLDRCKKCKLVFRFRVFPLYSNNTLVILFFSIGEAMTLMVSIVDDSFPICHAWWSSFLLSSLPPIFALCFQFFICTLVLFMICAPCTSFVFCLCTQASQYSQTATKNIKQYTTHNDCGIYQETK